MKSPLLSAFLLWLCVPAGHCGDCQADCLSCSRRLPKQLNFNTMVCLIECESNVSPAFTWDVCRGSSELPRPSSVQKKRAQEEVDAILPEGEENAELLNPFTLQRFDHISRALGLDERGLGSRRVQLDSAYPITHQEEEEEEEDEEGAETDGDQPDDEAAATSLNMSKRFGGFLKGRHGYKKLVSSPPGRPFQKRYGGFIGVRKSARKWNNQKRFSEFLKQYLGMSTRATEFSSMSEQDLTQQNEV